MPRKQDSTLELLELQVKALEKDMRRYRRERNKSNKLLRSLFIPCTCTGKGKVKE